MPWHRRSVVNLVFLLVGLVAPPVLWFVCYLLFTGPVYTPRQDESGNLKTWGEGSKWFALAIAGLQLYNIIRRL